MKQPEEKGTQRDLVLYRIETSKSDIKAAEILLSAREFRGANNQSCLLWDLSCNISNSCVGWECL